MQLVRMHGTNQYPSLSDKEADPLQVSRFHWILGQLPKLAQLEFFHPAASIRIATSPATASKTRLKTSCCDESDPASDRRDTDSDGDEIRWRRNSMVFSLRPSTIDAATTIRC